MQNWTPEMWQSALVGLVVGLILGYLLLRLTKGSVKKQLQTETELKKVKSELDQQKRNLEKHFSESAELLKTLAQDYQKLYQHLASSSAELLPQLENKILFENQLEEKKAEQDKTVAENNSEEPPPRDYSEGSSGILKAEK
ncbi:YhcB family protein [Avibacterium paragallinarum]|uniref:YhcB family protein n=1 Tax=Avibacterium paragallinarum TaxID=728 RepID=UPI0039871953